MSAFRPLNALRAAGHEVEAERFLALQLAAVFFVAEARPSTLEFVSLDGHPTAGVRREGLVTIALA